MAEINPNHEVTQKMNGQWHKIVAILMKKLGANEVVITANDIVEMGCDAAIAIQEQPDGLHIKMIDMETAILMAEKEGGLTH